MVCGVWERLACDLTLKTMRARAYLWMKAKPAYICDVTSNDSSSSDTWTSTSTTVKEGVSPISGTFRASQTCTIVVPRTPIKGVSLVVDPPSVPECAGAQGIKESIGRTTCSLYFLPWQSRACSDELCDCICPCSDLSPNSKVSFASETSCLSLNVCWKFQI